MTLLLFAYLIGIVPIIPTILGCLILAVILGLLNEWLTQKLAKEFSGG